MLHVFSERLTLAGLYYSHYSYKKEMKQANRGNGGLWHLTAWSVLLPVIGCRFFIDCPMSLLKSWQVKKVWNQAYALAMEFALHWIKPSPPPSVGGPPTYLFEHLCKFSQICEFHQKCTLKYAISYQLTSLQIYGYGQYMGTFLCTEWKFFFKTLFSKILLTRLG